MPVPRACLICLAGLCSLAAGCQSTPLVGGMFTRSGTAVAMNKPLGQLSPNSVPVVQTQLFLDPGMEILWQVATVQSQPGQVSRGTGMIGPDGTVVIGPYGTCKVAGLTLQQAGVALERHLAAYLKNPTVQLSAVLPASQTDLAWRSARTELGQTIVTTSRPSNIQPVTWGQPANVVVTAGPAAPQSLGSQGAEPGLLRRFLIRLGLDQR
jgi:hypothetical protein